MKDLSGVIKMFKTGLLVMLAQLGRFVKKIVEFNAQTLKMGELYGL